MAKNIDEETNRTSAQPAVVHEAGREAREKAENEETEIVEKAELEAPEPAEPAEPDQDAIDAMEDPRQAIYNRFSKKQRKFEEEGLESAEGVDTITPDSDDQPEMVEVKIYDEVRLVEKSKVDKAGGIQAYQKQLAVDEGFKRNAQQRQELEQREKRLSDWEQKLRDREQRAAVPAQDPHQPPPTPSDPPSGDQPKLSLGDLAAKYHEALLDGDDEERDRLFVQIQEANKASQSPIDVDEMTDRIAEKAAGIIQQRERTKKVRKATKQLIDSHPELDRNRPEYDQRLWTAIDDETDVIERENPDWEPQQVLDEAWSRIQKWKGGAEPSPLQSLEEKQQRKREMIRPQASTGRHHPPPPPPARTDSDYVKELRRQRGLE